MNDNLFQTQKYIHRPIAEMMLKSNSKVLILEGARAVGKTTLAKQELVQSGFKYVSLADYETYQTALENPTLWVKSLPEKVIIDEAQRIQQLPLIIKEIVDETSRDEPYYILTGSSSIGRSGLDGQDPLVRRSQRYTLLPITIWEYSGQRGNLVDKLIEDTPNADYKKEFSKELLHSVMFKGGFPKYLNTKTKFTPTDLSLMVQSDIDAVLGVDLLAGEKFDQGIAKRIFHNIVTRPGKVFNASGLGRELSFDARTIERYVSIFKNRFLIHSLANYNQTVHTQKLTRAKIHPIDTSFSIAEFRKSGKDINEEPSLYGEVLESFVVNQLIAAVQYSENRPKCFYWRESGRSPKEVDFVMVDSNRVIGVEIKSSTNVSLSDFKGILRLAESNSLHRGYIFYLGDKVKQFNDKLFALPITALWNSGAFIESSINAKKLLLPSTAKIFKSTSIQSSDIKSNFDANLFLSYNHDDNNHLDNQMIDFIHDVEEEYSYSHGNKLNIFIDKDSINWGEDWRSCIDKSLQMTNFIVPCITPRYLKSDACRAELTTFIDFSNFSEFRSILSLVWQTPDDSDNFYEDDPLFQTINNLQYVDVCELRNFDRKDKNYKIAVRQVTAKLRDVIKSNLSQAASKSSKDLSKNIRDGSIIKDYAIKQNIESHDDENDEAGHDGFCELIDKVVDNCNNLNRNMERAGTALNEITKAIDDQNVKNKNSGIPLSKQCLYLYEKTKDSVSIINTETASGIEHWNRVYESSHEIIKILELTPQLLDRKQSLEIFKSTFQGLLTDMSYFENTKDVEDSIQLLASLSAKLRPLAKATRNYLNLFKQITASAEVLLQHVDSAIECS